LFWVLLYFWYGLCYTFDVNVVWIGKLSMDLPPKKRRLLTMTSAESNRVETKVTASSVAAFLASIGVAVLNGVNDYSLLAGLPPLVQSLLVLIIPALVTFLSGYFAPHTPR
jgi:hypothetical protein